MPTARALRAFLRSDGSDWDWAGALMVSDLLAGVEFLKRYAEADIKARKRAAQKRRGKKK